MIRCYNSLHIIFHKGAGYDVRRFRLSFDQPDIYVVIQNILFNYGRGFDRNLCTQLREQRLVLFQQPGKGMRSAQSSKERSSGTSLSMVASVRESRASSS